MNTFNNEKFAGALQKINTRTPPLKLTWKKNAVFPFPKEHSQMIQMVVMVLGLRRSGAIYQMSLFISVRLRQSSSNAKSPVRPILIFEALSVYIRVTCNAPSV